MILYFTGTGNSKYVAQIIQSITEDELVSINNMIKIGGPKTLNSKKPLVFVAPIYAWRMPKVVSDFIENTTFLGNQKAYFILTCGMGSGNAALYAKKICEKKRFTYCGFQSVVMPENYILMFNTPDKKKSEKIIEKAIPKIKKIGYNIKNNKPLDKEKNFGTILSTIVNPMFYKFTVKADGFYSTKDCISCGKCAKICPLNNIKMVDGRPKWGKDCTHCMACICLCPKEAIEYKSKSKGKIRYHMEGFNGE